MKWFLYIGYIILFNKTFAILNCIKPSFESLNVQSDFNLNKFLGVWYEIQWLPGVVHNESDIWGNYYQLFQMDNSSSQKLVVPGKAQLLHDKSCFSFGPWSIIANNSAKMILEKQNISSTELINWPYYILKTDYEHYALIYGCMTNNYILTNPCEQPILWVFSRTASLSSNYTNELDQYIENTLCVNLTELEITPHDDDSCYSSSSSNIQIINLILLIFLSLLYI